MHHRASPFLQIHAVPVLIAHPRTIAGLLSSSWPWCCQHPRLRACALLTAAVLPQCCSHWEKSSLDLVLPAEILGQVRNTEPLGRDSKHLGDPWSNQPHNYLHMLSNMNKRENHQTLAVKNSFSFLHPNVTRIHLTETLVPENKNFIATVVV